MVVSDRPVDGEAFIIVLLGGKLGVCLLLGMEVRGFKAIVDEAGRHTFRRDSTMLAGIWSKAAIGRI
jgi:hypothetical protein